VRSPMAGRWFAWGYGGLALIGGVLALVVSSGIPSTDDLAVHYAYVRKIWPELYPAFLLLIAAFLFLAPLGLVLRARLGQGLRGAAVRGFPGRRPHRHPVDADADRLGPG